MCQEDYFRLGVDAESRYSCLLFRDESIRADLIALFVPSRSLTLLQLKDYLRNFGLTAEEVIVLSFSQRPRNAPLGGYIVTIPLPAS